MKAIRIAGLCLASMLVMGMAAAGTASAAPLWLLCLEGTSNPNTRYTSNQCTTAGSGSSAKWESVSAPTKAMANTTSFTLTLKDTKTALGVSEVRCNAGGRSKGTVGPGGKDEVTSAEVEKSKENCRGLKVCESESIKEVKAIHLPWKTELFETESAIQDKIEGTGGGAGWKVVCSAAFVGERTDECEAETGKPEIATLTNAVTSGVLLVKGVFLNRRKAKCTEGGKESGEVTGTFAILLANGNGLSINTK